MNWARVNSENLGRRHGYEQMETGPFCGPTAPARKKKTYPRLPRPPKPPKPARPPKVHIDHAGPPPANLRSYDGRRVE
jgi:hypothetical protein